MPAPKSKGKKRARSVALDSGETSSSKRIKSDLTDSPSSAYSEEGLSIQMQEKFCLATAYKDAKLSRCTSCSRRNGMDTCRFRDVRFILRDTAGACRGIGFKSKTSQTLGRVVFPVSWNSELRKVHVGTIKHAIASGLLPVLQREIKHLEQKDTICRPREVDVRATCDTCLTSLFSLSWMCRLCGREACADCYAKLCAIPPNITPATAPKDRRDPEKRLIACVPRESHSFQQFFPVSRFSEQELRAAVKEMSAILSDEKYTGPELRYSTPVDTGKSLANLDLLAAVVAAHPHLPNTGRPSANSEVKTSASSPSTPDPPPPNQRTPTKPPPASIPPSVGDSIPLVRVETTSHDVEVATTSSTSEHLSSPLLPISPSTSASDLSRDTQRLKSKSPAQSVNPFNIGDGIPFHPTVTFSDSALTEETFRQVWAEGRPLVVKGVLDKFNIKWTPEYFIEKYGDHSCTIVDCVTEAKQEVTVGWFFAMFGKYDERIDSRVWKLKDWPSWTDFKSAFPELYDDFARAVPIQSYCRRDGVLNIASHFPSNAVAPDLGPKMYNAFATSDTEGSKGSTRLHMDMADAVNMMVHVEPCADGTPGGARWDLFRAEDAPAIRQFLSERFKLANGLDPIHSQQFYLDKKLRAELYAKTGVRSHRVIQRQGEAVFIPAGCAHQVCNLSDCIKVAADFVSPENIERCARLTEEFRAQNLERMWKEDVLQLQTMMWYAWVSCSRPEIAGTA
ncbi:hypothetical protein B0F90DRAFT_1723573 [Multifurca ochricompacta]|uniref:JmjC domain-containing protein n=1 Tax=Multifurca ochricompacta TaxID=376703 RepID=A0AAD4M3Z3_9AGAM|nr:hypothetical protein B0F90DRAFT_1723573 [Multifurca ochricompacta]